MLALSKTRWGKGKLKYLTLITNITILNIIVTTDDVTDIHFTTLQKF